MLLDSEISQLVLELVAPYSTLIAANIAVGFLVFALRWWSSRFDYMFRFICYTPIFFTTMLFDRSFGFINFFVDFPTSPSGVRRNPKRLFGAVLSTDLPLMQKQAICRSTFAPNIAGAGLSAPRIVPKGSKFVSVESIGGSQNDTSRCAVRVTYGFPTSPEARPNAEGIVDEKAPTSFENMTKEWQVAFPSNAVASSLGKRALGAAMNSVPLEISFYRHVAPLLKTITLPVAVASQHSRFFGRSMIVTERLPPKVWTTVSEEKGCTPGQVSAMLVTQAAVHARFWQPPAKHLNLRFIRARQGLEWLDGIRLGMPEMPDWANPLWNILRGYFIKVPVALSHGDARPANAFFARPQELNPDQKKEAGVDEWVATFQNWGSVAIAPFLWDFTVTTVIGQSSSQRRSLAENQMKAYTEELFDRNRQAMASVVYGLPGAMGPANALPAFANVRALMTLVLYYAWNGASFPELGLPKRDIGPASLDATVKERIGKALLDEVRVPLLAPLLTPHAPEGTDVSALLREVRQTAQDMTRRTESK